MSIKPILTVGIDVGTTSMHLSINRLSVSNVSRIGEPERLVICEREKIYESPVQFTPLLEDGSIDAEAIFLFLDKHYRRAQLKVSDIASGAIIVTGETAKIRNAESVVEKVSSLAGQFVVSSAGPNYESVLAGRGSGAAEYSKLNEKVVCNIDIGGGTTNIALFKNGKVKSTSAVAFGGRLICLSDEMDILKITDAGRYCFAQLGVTAEVGSKLSDEMARQLATYASEKIVEAITIDAWNHPMLITSPLAIAEPIDEFWISGGIADVMSKLSASDSDTKYGDLGIFLARCLVESLQTRGIDYRIPPDPIRATVLGAAVHSLQLSGSTVTVSERILPLRDIPVIEPSWEGSDQVQPTLDIFTARVSEALSAQDRSWTDEPIALYLPLIPRTGYASIKAWAELIARTCESFGAVEPLVILCANDVSNALGQCLRVALPGRAIVCLDGIAEGSSGDYIDVGKPLAGTSAVPVILKSLVFQH